MKRNKKKLSIILFSTFLFLPIIVYALTSQRIHGFNFNLSALKSTQYTFTTASNHPYQTYIASVSTLIHDGGPGNCTFCKLNVKVDKKSGILYLPVSNFPHTVTSSGWSEKIIFGEIGTGTYRYTMTNNGAYQMNGYMSISEQDAKN